MSTDTHTPGPWAVDNQYIHGPDGIRFLAVAGDGAGQANARLIASAPELLAALEATEAKLTQAARAFYGAGNAKALREAFEGWRTTAEAARAAIAKATATK